MNDLLNKKCVPCEGGVLPFDISEIHKYQKKVDGWDISKDIKEKFFLNKRFNFNNFKESPTFKKDNKTNFFNLGFKNKWQQNLPEEISNKIKNKFFNELKELKYE